MPPSKASRASIGVSYNEIKTYTSAKTADLSCLLAIPRGNGIASGSRDQSALLTGVASGCMALVLPAVNAPLRKVRCGAQHYEEASQFHGNRDVAVTSCQNCRAKHVWYLFNHLKSVTKELGLGVRGCSNDRWGRVSARQPSLRLQVETGWAARLP